MVAQEPQSAGVNYVCSQREHIPCQLLYPRSPSEMRKNPPVVCLDRRHPVSLSTLGRSFVPWHAGPGMTGQYILHKILDNWPEWFSEEPPGIGLVNVEWDNEENEVQ